jgi:hypothetical protein
MQTQSPSNITHKPADLISDEVDFLDERNKQNTRLRSENAADMTPPKGVTQQPALISPSPSSHSISSNSSSGDISEDDYVKKIAKTEHRIAELEGRHLPEPLLTENPGRFVLFPIQDNDVSVLSLNFSCSKSNPSD